MLFEKLSVCHASESWHPVILRIFWMPAFAGMTHIAWKGNNGVMDVL